MQPQCTKLLHCNTIQPGMAGHPCFTPPLYQSNQNTSNGPGENPPGCPCTQLMAFMDGIQILCLHPTGHFHPALSHLQEELTRPHLHVYTFPNVEVLFKSSRPGALPALHTGMHSHAQCTSLLQCHIMLDSFRHGRAPLLHPPPVPEQLKHIQWPW